MNRYRIVPILTAAAVALALPAAAATVVGTSHDLTTGATVEVCVYCHTPHQAATAAGQDPLWNHTLSTNATYGVYGSVTLDASDILDIGAAAVGSASTSSLCMSCHDGTVAAGSLYNDPATGAPTNAAITGTANLGTDLSDDHPVNFTYQAALATNDGGLVTPTDATTVDGTVPLFGGRVQCASCHDPHDNTNSPFLVATNTGSALCLRCHLK